MNRATVTFASLLTLTACASAPNGAPSLLPRAAEGQSFDEPAATPAASAVPDRTLDRAIAALATARKKAIADFAAADRATSDVIAAGSRARVGSDAWLDAQTAIGALDAGRADILGVQTEFEQLAIARATEGHPPYPALETEQSETQVELNRIDAVLTRRKAALPL